MKLSEVEWSRVEKVEKVVKEKGNAKEEEIIFDFEGASSSLTVELEYTVYSYYSENDGTYYQRVLHLPFYAVSGWTKEKPKEKDIENFLKSKLRQKYKSLIERDWYHRERMKKLKEILEREEITKEDLSRLYHDEPVEKIHGKTIGSLWKEWENVKKKSYSQIQESSKTEDQNVLSWKKFLELTLNDNCYYCGISIKEINDLKLYTKRARGYIMEIDQLDANGFYTDGNCVACCYWCNNAKTDEFSDEEFKKIGNAIAEVWKKRGAQKETV